MSLFFSSLKNCFCPSRQHLDSSRQIAIYRDSSTVFYRVLDSFSIATLIHQETFWMLDNCSIATLIHQDPIMDTSWHLLDRSRYPCMNFIFLLFCFFFFLCVHSILFSFSYRSMVPYSPRSLYVSFLSVSYQVFWPFMPLTIMSKRGRNLRIECLSSGGVIDLGGELHV